MSTVNKDSLRTKVAAFIDADWIWSHHEIARLLNALLDCTTDDQVAAASGQVASLLDPTKGVSAIVWEETPEHKAQREADEAEFAKQQKQKAKEEKTAAKAAAEGTDDSAAAKQVTE